jgi:hypothetical protein
MVIQGFAGNDLKDAMEVERREAGDGREAVEREIAVEMLGDVVQYAIDTVVIVLVGPHEELSSVSKEIAAGESFWR